MTNYDYPAFQKEIMLKKAHSTVLKNDCPCRELAQERLGMKNVNP